MTYPIYPFGHDFGNAEECAVLIWANGRKELRIPSVTCAGTWAQVQAFASGQGKNVQDTIAADHYILSYRQDVEPRMVEKFVGKKVADSGNAPLTTLGDDSRYWLNNYSLEMLMVASASLTNSREYGLHVVTGMPIDLYLNDPQNKVNVMNALLGTHVFTLNGTQRIMHVESVKVIMEGAGAVIEHGSTEDLPYQGVIDVGGRTTDMFVARGQAAQQAKSFSVNLGVATIASRFNAKYREAYHTQLSDSIVSELLYQHVNNLPYKGVRYQGTPISHDRMYALIESSMREIGQDIATEITRKWGNAVDEMDTILIVGGGAYYVAQDIQDRIPGAKLVYKPELANAYGYGLLAEAAMRRFNAAKGA